jgi:WD40 repeat protein
VRCGGARDARARRRRAARARGGGAARRPAAAWRVGGVWSAQFSPDGQNIVSVGEDNTVRVWSVATGECVQTLVGHGGVVRSVQFSPDGQNIVSASYDNTKAVEPNSRIPSFVPVQHVQSHRRIVC